ncbi:DUF4362 domain-containing protein [Actinoplanes sp. TRM 88003]|uniref:DUF4362 domain-containing protein n=1 Tax=Paractinoplanes aksuensis TaxID=2939490 RepID=A0ABT1DG97_9ACTN|nr:DUF4362 domain-containing protein [Actinoplanes aksuensis]MCO8269847.1 DUF4362 domain-containing protein [Actinoplanes aksuensis]
MRLRPAALALSLLITTGALAACGGTGDPPNRVGPATATIEPQASESAPMIDPSLGPRPRAGGSGGPSTTLRPGQGALDCGTFVLGQGEKLPDTAARCFVDAAQAGHRARLAVTRPTVEGDPIPVTYTSGTDGRTEVITDSRQDGFGPKEITRQTCQGPAVADYSITFTRCTQPAPVTN